jgi:hypothetical protein
VDIYIKENRNIKATYTYTPVKKVHRKRKKQMERRILHLELGTSPRG